MYSSSRKLFVLEILVTVLFFLMFYYISHFSEVQSKQMQYLAG